jgi:hypothetical protein
VASSCGGVLLSSSRLWFLKRDHCLIFLLYDGTLMPKIISQCSESNGSNPYGALKPYWRARILRTASSFKPLVR